MQILPNFLKHYTITELERQIYDVHFPWHYPQAEGEPDQYVNLLYYDHKFSNAMNPMLMRCLRAITDQLRERGDPAAVLLRRLPRHRGRVRGGGRRVRRRRLRGQRRVRRAARRARAAARPAAAVG